MKLLVNLGKGVIRKDNDDFIFELDGDDLEYGISLLQSYIDIGFFEVAEFAKVTKSDPKKLIQVYLVSQS